MGLAVEVGVLADLMEEDPEGADWIREGLQQVNALLAKSGLPPHVEPEVLPPLRSRAPVDSYPYSFLHYLRRAAAHVFDDPTWVADPVPEEDDPGDDPVLIRRYDLLDSHLLCHSDAEGFYLPQEFTQVLFGSDELEVPGGMVGSSPMLHRELVQIAPSIGVRLDREALSDEEVARLSGLIDAEDGLFREIIVWLSLFEAARLSREHGSAICFT